ncbi:hypothetical protein L0B52_04565 [Suttonella sp. R2A3]|uniref:hypothetical protein n=1 Tax=Suttonella sp. R2A3 TaxID=2908648 RepID=UPI001F267436|nr:hypothetical protein [Suttonella sp. R2A3]UJF25423.1 hypothetical protein L0B52_04565 [Suttonella sp. R2A3]
MMRTIALFFCWLIPSALLAENEGSWSITEPFGISIGSSTLQDVQQRFNYQKIWFSEEPAQPFFHGVYVAMPGWNIYSNLIPPSEDSLLNKAGSISFWIDDQGAIGQIALAFHSETSSQANELYQQLNQRLKQQATLDQPKSLYEAYYLTNYIIYDPWPRIDYSSPDGVRSPTAYDEAPPLAEAYITESLAAYHQNHLSLLLVKKYYGYLDSEKALPEHIALQDYGELYYAEFAAPAPLPFKDDPAYMIGLVISSDAFQQPFADNVQRVAASGKLNEIAQVTFNKLLQNLND